jgi:N-acetylglucosamine-6-phosphate deacetylase
MFRPPTPEDSEQITARRVGGVTLVTLAPEQVPAGFIAQLARAGVRVSLGHSMATYAQTRMALEQGLTGFTHLFNAMRQPQSAGLARWSPRSRPRAPGSA